MKYRLDITCDNDAFSNDDGTITAYSARHEIARILRSAAAAIDHSQFVLVDINGNTVGTAGFEK